MDRQELQDRLYSLPYHHLPWTDDGAWRIEARLDWGFQYLALLETVLNLIRSRKPNTVLDFGCGDARLIRELASHADPPVCLGVDLSEHALAQARAMTHESRNVHFHSSLDEIDGRFLPVDLVVAMEVLEHIEPTLLPGVLKDLSEVLRDHGYLVASVPTTNLPLNPKHYQHFTLQQLLEYTDPYFELEEVTYVHKISFVSGWLRRALVNRFFLVVWRPWLKLLTQLYKRWVLLADAASGAHVVVVLRKKPVHHSD